MRENAPFTSLLAKIDAHDGTARPRAERADASHVAPAKAAASSGLRSPQSLTRQGWNVMGFFSQDIKNMDDLFVHTLRDIYYAENQIVKALPDMIEKATDSGLKQGFQTHLGETKNHVKRLEQVFKMRGVEAKGVDCPAIDGII